MGIPKLIYIYQSPWSERARWGFEFKGVPYERVDYQVGTGEEELKQQTDVLRKRLAGLAPTAILCRYVPGDSADPAPDDFPAISIASSVTACCNSVPRVFSMELSGPTFCPAASAPRMRNSVYSMASTCISTSW